MKRLFSAAFVYMILGLLGGLFYREYTKAHDFDGTTQLAVVHTHLLVLGMLVPLIALLFEAQFRLSESKLFGWFFVVYNAGLALSVAMMVWHGMLQVTGATVSPAISGIAGLGHIFLTVAFVLFFLMLGQRLNARKVTARLTAGEADASSAVSAR